MIGDLASVAFFSKTFTEKISCEKRHRRHFHTLSRLQNGSYAADQVLQYSSFLLNNVAYGAPSHFLYQNQSYRAFTNKGILPNRHHWCGILCVDERPHYGTNIPLQKLLIARCCFLSCSQQKNNPPPPIADGREINIADINTTLSSSPFCLRKAAQALTGQQVVQYKMSNLLLWLLWVICATAPGWKYDAWAEQSGGQR